MPVSDTTINLDDGAVLTLERAGASSAGKVRAFRHMLHANALHLNANAHEAAQSWLTTRRILAHAHDTDDALFLLGRIDGDIVGELQMRRSVYQRLSHDMRIALGVSPHHQKRGIGRALLNAGIAWAKANTKVKRLSLSVHADNHHAMALYESLGFSIEGRRRGAILPHPALAPSGQSDQEPIDEVLMGLLLP